MFYLVLVQSHRYLQCKLIDAETHFVSIEFVKIKFKFKYWARDSACDMFGPGIEPAIFRLTKRLHLPTAPQHPQKDPFLEDTPILVSLKDDIQ